MSAAMSVSYMEPNGNMSQPQQKAKPFSVQEVIGKVMILRAYTKQTGFRTTRSESELLRPLSGPELTQVLEALARSEKL
jgi:hypothetical protein